MSCGHIVQNRVHCESLAQYGLTCGLIVRCELVYEPMAHYGVEYEPVASLICLASSLLQSVDVYRK